MSILEIAFSVHDETINDLKKRVEDLEETKEGKSCIGFIEDGEEPLVGM